MIFQAMGFDKIRISPGFSNIEISFANIFSSAEYTRLFFHQPSIDLLLYINIVWCIKTHNLVKFLSVMS